MKLENVEILGSISGPYARILSPDAIGFVAALNRQFNQRRIELLERRKQVQRELDAGKAPDFIPETAGIRSAQWTIAPIPTELLDRRVEITGPVDRKMIINALNSGANVFMADFEDSHSPTWEGTIEGQLNLHDTVRRAISFTSPDGKYYELNEKTAVLFVRPRGWHLVEKHFLVDGTPASAALFDFGLFFFHNAKELLRRGTGPYFYLPKLENHLEARLWNDVFIFAQERLGLTRGTIKATVLIETILAAFEMDEILFELREHSAGLNCGRWDYIFSFIKKFRNRSDFVLPDRAEVTMNQHFLRSYSELLIKTCHKRRAHAMGGMAAQIPIKNDPEANAAAMAKVIEDKEREVRQGHDGTWVAHPGLVPVAKNVFERFHGANQLTVLREDVAVTAADLLKVPIGQITEAGIRTNVSVGVQYLEAWLGGLGCVPLYNLMEDAATAEISRAQLWQWVRHGRVTLAQFRGILAEEMARIRHALGDKAYADRRFNLASRIFDRITTDSTFPEFLTVVAYDYLDTTAVSGQGAAERDWRQDSRWKDVKRPYSAADVRRLRGSLQIEHTLARRGAEQLWQLLHSRDYVVALGALTGNQALQQVEAGLEAVYLSGWQVAADANASEQMYPDQSLYAVNSVPSMARKINHAFARADQIAHAEGRTDRNWFVPIVADAEAGFGGTLNAFELTKELIEAGCAAVHLEDQLASVKKCGHMGGKVLVPTSEFIHKLNAARLAADLMGVPTVIIARTDAQSAKLVTSDIDPRDREFMTGERTSEGFFRIRGGIDAAITRATAYAPYADLLWCETSAPDLDEARRFADGVHAEYPRKLLAYNCSPSFNWKRNLDDKTIALFQKELAAMGYKFQFVTLAGFHALNFSMFELASAFRVEGMAAYSRLQQAEFAAEARGYRAAAHQKFVGTEYFDDVAQTIAGGPVSTTAWQGSTEEEQFGAKRAHQKSA